MSTDAFIGHGTTLTWGGVAVAEINAIGGISLTRDKVDATDLQSPDKYREWIAGLKDSGELSLSMNFVRDAVDEFVVDFDSGEIKEAVITFPDNGATSFTFDGFVSAMEIGVPLETKVPCETKIKITGPITLGS